MVGSDLTSRAHPKRLVTRLKGGLGNQLFIYAAARRLSIANDAELVLDTKTGFERDRQYERRYCLERFSIAGRQATPSERLEPFSRLRRLVMRRYARSRPFNRRRYLEQDGEAFDGRLLTRKINGTVWLDGLWQSERYFKDATETIRRDLTLRNPYKETPLAAIIRRCSAVAVHFRWFDPANPRSKQNLPIHYHSAAIQIVAQKVDDPIFVVFSDDVELTEAALGQLTPHRRIIKSDGRTQLDDFYLMSQCQHIIIANSTFSWWAAWLVGGDRNGLVVAPDMRCSGPNAWGFPGLLPERWLTVKVE
jgi:hypothetical protein